MNNSLLPIVFSDLDQTMIYSQKQLHKHHDSTISSLVVEDYRNAPLSYMSLKTWKFLSMNSSVKFRFVPITTRSIHQFQRLSLPDINFSDAVYNNGADIFIDGKKDNQWTEKIVDTLNSYTHSPKNLLKKSIKHIDSLSYVKKINIVDNLFFYFVTDSYENKNLKNILEGFVGDDYVISQQGFKTYVVPKCLNKGSAIKHIIDYYGDVLSFACGDSILDVDMSTYVDYFMQPRHGEGIGYGKPSFITSSSGLKASDEILEYIIQIINNEK